MNVLSLAYDAYEPFTHQHSLTTPASTTMLFKFKDQYVKQNTRIKYIGPYLPSIDTRLPAFMAILQFWKTICIPLVLLSVRKPM